MLMWTKGLNPNSNLLRKPNSNDLGSHKNTLDSRKLNKNTNKPN